MVAKRRRRSHHSSYRLLVLHLLKWQFQPERRSRSWRLTINRERAIILEREDGGRGRQLASVEFDDIHTLARREAARETGLPRSDFPSACPYSLDFLRDPDALPD